MQNCSAKILLPPIKCRLTDVDIDIVPKKKKIGPEGPILRSNLSAIRLADEGTSSTPVVDVSRVETGDLDEVVVEASIPWIF